MKNNFFKKRRQVLIKKGFQLKYTVCILSIMLTVMLITGTGIYFGMWASISENFSKFKISEELETAKRIADYEGVRYKKGDYRLDKIFREAELLSQRQKESLKVASQAVNRSLLPKIALLALILFIGGVFLSHKIAGPMYRFERSAKAVQNGDLRVGFHVRKGDEMKKSAQALDEMLRALKTDIEKAKSARNTLMALNGAITRNLSEKETERVKDALNDLDTILKKYKT